MAIRKWKLTLTIGPDPAKVAEASVGVLPVQDNVIGMLKLEDEIVEWLITQFNHFSTTDLAVSSPEFTDFLHTKD